MEEAFVSGSKNDFRKPGLRINLFRQTAPVMNWKRETFPLALPSKQTSLIFRLLRKELPSS
jgi:hypothetical protein